MTRELLYWVLMVLWFVLGLYEFRGAPRARWPAMGGGLVLFLVVLVLGIQVFGVPFTE